MKRLLWMLPLLAIALGAVTSYVYSSATNNLLEDLGRSDSPALSRVQALAFDLTSVADGFKSAAAAADASALDAVDEKVKRLRSGLKAYGDVPGRAEEAARLSTAFEAYQQTASKVTRLIIAGKADELGDAPSAMQAAFTTLDKDLATQKAQTQAALDAHIEQTQALVHRGFAANIAASLLMLALSVGVSIAAVRELTRQLGGRPEDATHIVQRIAGGDLSEPVQLKTQDERSLLFSMRSMQERLSEVIGEVRDAVHQVHDAVGALGKGNEVLSERSERQRQSLHASASSIDQLTASVRSNADSAEQARLLAHRASTVADEGGRAVADAVDAMAAISDRARKIVEITSLIDGIAFQTNILALNAAVEAARAGEQGRGFNVVAGEVRSLAQRASAAAKDIKTLIDDSASRIEDGSRHVNAAGAVMSNLVESVKQVGHHVEQISTASSEQRSGIEHVNAMVAELSGHTEDNHKLVAEAGQASQLLQQVAAQLGVAVGRFRLDDTAPNRS
ncbi:methyl-accepting chemotaxis protein [Roseateles cellulosilyticus]|uniref:Methyl-accepting chemotaxis protein n=1 Tax=Pelomonas cellulosilytica TaxID=2906762 RepID=A0ABS8XUH0_9BURK|nr:methyl-accepting chemotaxis protein [Pelomonas sp. P8]MCE4555382.1 methyl-accepting chemotaxis protein [Pelomonas sp. P8]